jgi:hypothetical protein
MPFALLIIGVVLVVAGARQKQGDLFNLLLGDFTGANNFLFWFVSILIIGALGYVPKLKPLSTGLLVLVILVLFLTKGNPSGVGGGFFGQFTSALKGTESSSNSAASTAASNSSNTSALSPLAPLSGLDTGSLINV